MSSRKAAEPGTGLIPLYSFGFPEAVVSPLHTCISHLLSGNNSSAFPEVILRISEK